MTRTTRVALRFGSTLIALWMAAPSPAAAQTGDLAAFGARMVGAWEAADSRHVFEWGVGERILKSSSYWPDGADWRLVSEGVWYWDPVDEVIRGRTVAVGMGIDLFEYTTRISPDAVVHDFVAHGEMSGRFVERWVFEGDAYTWTVEQDGEALLSGSYRRAR